MKWEFGKPLQIAKEITQSMWRGYFCVTRFIGMLKSIHRYTCGWQKHFIMQTRQKTVSHCPWTDSTEWKDDRVENTVYQVMIWKTIWMESRKKWMKLDYHRSYVLYNSGISWGTDNNLHVIEKQQLYFCAWWAYTATHASVDRNSILLVDNTFRTGPHHHEIYKN